jgi:hypothetical protein
MTVHNFDKNEMRECIHSVYEDMDNNKEKMKENIIDDAKTRWLVSKISEKLEMVYEYAFRVTQRNEDV